MSRNKLAIAIATAACLYGAASFADDAPSTTLGGVGYFDFTDLTTQKNGTDVDVTGLGTDVKRFYVIVGHQFDDTWSANFTSDFNFSSTTGETQLFVKKAYIQGRFDPLATLRLGSADTPWIPYVEGLYGYRFVEKTITDRLGFGNSADWGVNLSGANDSFNYSASAVNGGGFKNPTRSKSVDEELRAGFRPIDSLTIALGYYTGKLGQDTEAAEAAASASKPPFSLNTASRSDALAVWQAEGLKLGLEYFTADNFTKAAVLNAKGAGTDKMDGYSLFGSYDFSGTDYSLFARYDNASPSKDLDPSQKDKYYNAGFAWKSNANLTWAAVYKYEDLKDNATDLKSTEIGIFAQVKF
jgi:hypothetical protein